MLLFYKKIKYTCEVCDDNTFDYHRKKTTTNYIYTRNVNLPLFVCFLLEMILIHNKMDLRGGSLILFSLSHKRGYSCMLKDKLCFSDMVPL